MVIRVKRRFSNYKLYQIDIWGVMKYVKTSNLRNKMTRSRDMFARTRRKFPILVNDISPRRWRKIPGFVKRRIMRNV